MELSRKILITGASGFIGRTLTSHLLFSRFQVTALTRGIVNGLPAAIHQYQFGGFPSKEDLRTAFEGVDTVIHCAARVHVMNESESDPLASFRGVNVEGTRNLAEQAKRAGVKRFIFLSSIKVNGEETGNGRAFRSSDIPMPIDPYGTSKREAEDVIRELTSESGMEHVIIRPVLVYGPGIKANFAQLIRFIAKGLPLPLGSTKNKRSLVALDNLLDLITTCIDHPNAANQTFLVSDDNDLSTAGLIREVARCLGKGPRLFPFPPGLLKLAAQAIGKGAVADRLLGSLQVDISHTCETLGWRPPVSTAEALQKTVYSFSRT